MKNNSYSLAIKLNLVRKGEPFKDESAMLTWIAACLNCNTNHVEASVAIAPVPTVVLNMDRGLIQNESADQPVRLIVLDADTEGEPLEDLCLIDGEEVLVSDHNPVNADAEYVGRVVMDVDAQPVPTEAAPE